MGAILDIENVSEEVAAVNRLENIDTDHITPNPTQPRTLFDEQALEELADSITTFGLIQPITVKRHGAEYVIISGERRWRASKAAGLTTIPAYVLDDVNDQTLHEMALVENIQRQDLNAMEIAVSLQRLIDECDITQETVASRVGKKRSTVANYLRLLSLPAEVQAALKQETITMGHAKAIASVDEKRQLHLLHRVLKNGLSVRATELLAKKINEPAEQQPSAADVEMPDNYTRLVEQLSQLLTDDICIKPSAGGRGKIIIGFNSDEQIDALLTKLERLNG